MLFNFRWVGRFFFYSISIYAKKNEKERNSSVFCLLISNQNDVKHSDCTYLWTREQKKGQRWEFNYYLSDFFRILQLSSKLTIFLADKIDI